jgi:hypothetical protein
MFRRHGRRTTAAALGAVVVVAVAVFGFASPAQAAKTTQGAVAYNHVTAPKSYLGAFLSGVAVTMQCWRDGDWSYGTNRWFWVNGYGIRPNGSGGVISGFVSANLISNQSVVPRCSWS